MIVVFKPENCYPPRRGAVSLDRILLKPGANHLSDDDYAKLKAHPDYARYAAGDRKALVAHEPKSEVEKVPSSEVPKDLSGYNVEAAEDIIDNTHDIDVLKAWSKADVRVGIKKAIALRVKDLES